MSETATISDGTPSDFFHNALHALRTLELERVPRVGTRALSVGANGRWYFEWMVTSIRVSLAVIGQFPPDGMFRAPMSPTSVLAVPLCNANPFVPLASWLYRIPTRPDLATRGHGRQFLRVRLGGVQR